MLNTGPLLPSIQQLYNMTPQAAPVHITWTVPQSVVTADAAKTAEAAITRPVRFISPSVTAPVTAASKVATKSKVLPAVGAATGAVTGFMIGGPVGAAIGGIIGWFVG